MVDNNSLSPVARRSFLSRLGVGAAAVGLVGAAIPAQAQTARAARVSASASYA